MQTIPLGKTQEKFALVDDCDYERLAKYNWSVIKNNNAFYARRLEGPQGAQKVILMHRVIMDAPDDVKVDHINGDGLCNLRSNLRIATHAQNMRNRRVDKRSTSKVTGVRWYPQKQKWHALIMINGKRTHLGYFNTLEEATAVRKAAETQHYGEFART